jgi:hypothetical protein
MQEGKKSELKIDQCEKLKRIGFKFQSQNAAWEEQFQRLVDFKKINGHTSVCTYKTKGCKSLGYWVCKQRENARSLREGRPSPLTMDRIKKLESIGFEFRPRKGSVQAKYKLECEKRSRDEIV